MTLEYKKPLPLIMNNRTIGTITYDKNGKIDGQLIGTGLLDLLNDLFDGGCLEVMFHGRPGNVSPNGINELNATMRKFLREER